MNIIITGPKHCGKSTVINKIISAFQGNISGFISKFDDRSSAARELHISNISGTLSRCAVKWQNGPCRIFYEAFDEFAAGLINKESDLVIIDELGKFEKHCENLKKTVAEVFDSPCHTVISIRLDAAGWMQELKDRSDIMLINLTDDCRDSLPEYILGLLK